MQYDNSDDPYGFWNDEPTRQLKRTQAGTRAHADTRMVPVVHTDRSRPVQPLHHPRNPLAARVGLMVGVMLLLVPIALSLRNDTQKVRAASVRGFEPVAIGQLPSPAPTEATIPPSTLAPTTILVTTEAPTTLARIEVVVATAAPTDPPTTAAKAKKKATPKSTTTQATAAPATVTQSADKSCATTYTIASGDAWSSIASRAKVTMKALLAANNATVNTVLLPGKSICLPAGAVDPGPPSKASATTQPTTTQPKTSTTKPSTTQPPTPPQTTVPASTQPAPPPNTFSKAQVAQIIRDVWPDDLEDEAIRIATRESNLIPTVRNACCYGLFQIFYAAHKSWLAGIGITSPAQLYDPTLNARSALALYNISGWAPWAITTPTTSLA